MLSEELKHRIAEEAAHVTRSAWGDVNPRTLGELVAAVARQAANGTLGTPTFSEYADARLRTEHAEHVLRRDAALDALLEQESQLRKTLCLIADLPGPEGIVSFASDHGLALAECERFLHEEDRPLALVEALALGD